MAVDVYGSQAPPLLRVELRPLADESNGGAGGGAVVAGDKLQRRKVVISHSPGTLSVYQSWEWRCSRWPPRCGQKIRRRREEACRYCRWEGTSESLTEV